MVFIEYHKKFQKMFCTHTSICKRGQRSRKLKKSFNGKFKKIMYGLAWTV